MNEAYFIGCDSSTTNIADLNSHQVSIQIGAAFLVPSGFTLNTDTLNTPGTLIC